MTSISQLLECRRTAKNLQRFLDRDPSAPLSEEDRERVRVHLAECGKCAALSEEYRVLHRSLERFGATLEPEPGAVDRVRVAVRKALDAQGS